MVDSMVQVSNSNATKPMLRAYRHDAHKFTGHSHDAAPEQYYGVEVNQSVPHSADAHAAALSRPCGQPEQTVDTHRTHYRLSLLDGESRYTPGSFSRSTVSTNIADLLTETGDETMHRKWLTSKTAAAFNESAYYPYTSLKYHTLLVAALLDNYRAGHEFADLLLVVDDAEHVVTHRTVYTDEHFSLRIDADPGEQPSARLGSSPWRSWAIVWSRVTQHPLETDRDKEAMVLDANLRRIRAWSTALQYIEDFREVFDS